SCEAMVLIKDPKQVGKKIDCPNCKFRFVVEDPAETETEEPAQETIKPKAKSNTAVTAKKPNAPPPKPAAADTQPAVKKKAGPKKPVDEDEDDDEGPRPKKKVKSGNMVVILGVGLAVCALVVLGVGGYFLFIAGKEESHVGPVTRPGVGGTRV